MLFQVNACWSSQRFLWMWECISGGQLTIQWVGLTRIAWTKWHWVYNMAHVDGGSVSRRHLRVTWLHELCRVKDFNKAKQNACITNKHLCVLTKGSMSCVAMFQMAFAKITRHNKTRGACLMCCVVLRVFTCSCRLCVLTCSFSTRCSSSWVCTKLAGKGCNSFTDF